MTAPDITIPDEAAQAAHDVFWNAQYNGTPIDLEIEFDRLFYYALAAAINAWPGMHVGPSPADARRNSIILPLQQETSE